MDMLEAFCGESSKKPKKLLKEYGGETDKDYDVDISDFKELLPQKKPLWATRSNLRKTTKKRKP